MTYAGSAPQAVARVVAVVPAKGLELAKSRVALSKRERRAYALAFVADTLAALAGCEAVAAVLVVTADAEVAEVARECGAEVVADDSTSLNEAVALGVQLARTSWPELAVLIAPADLPCLRSQDVQQVLLLAQQACGATGFGAFLPDREGTGTTLVVLPADPLRPASNGAPLTAYGPGSASRHAALGLHRLDAAPTRARHDVDTLADLDDALTLGVGPHTTALTLASSLPSP